MSFCHTLNGMKYFDVKSDRKTGPYEKFLEFGGGSLTDAELLAVILRTGTPGEDTVSIARKILSLSRDGNEGILGLYHLSIEELMSVKGIGKVKAIKLKCLAELSSRMSMRRAKDSLCFDKPVTVAEYYMESMRHIEHEEVLLIMLDGRNHLIADTVLGKGTAKSSPISSREVMLTALKHSAVYIMLLHNHPGGDPTPSPQDIEATKKVGMLSVIADIPLLDHIVIGDNCYYSFREHKIL